MNLWPEDVEEILRLLDAAGAQELHLETERLTVTWRRAAGGGWAQETQVRSAPDLVAPAAEPPADTPPPPPPARDGLWEVRAPLVGTFYRAPAPGAPPFVEVGSQVAADSVVGIVETMKLMNPVLAGVAGRVAEICRADAQFTEQDAVLLRIEPAAP